MPLAKALLSQFLATAAVLAALRLSLVDAAHPALLALAQGACAALVAGLLRSERWWLAIHLGFVPLVLAARHLGLAPGWYLAAFVLCALVFWSSYRTRVPLYLSNRRTAGALAGLLPAAPGGRLLDIGSGTGSLLRPLARQRPDWHFAGIESAPLTHLVGRALGAGVPNLEQRRGDFFAEDWSRYDVIYAFLSPVPMAAVWAKACAEMRPGSLLVSNSFAVPEVPAECEIEVGDRRRTRLLCYRPGSRKSKKGR